MYIVYQTYFYLFAVGKMRVASVVNIKQLYDAYGGNIDVRILLSNCVRCFLCIV
jgi:hypothetical protein